MVTCITTIELFCENESEYLAWKDSLASAVNEQGFIVDTDDPVNFIYCIHHEDSF